MKEAPKHAFEVKISIGANTQEFIERALKELLETVRRGGTSVMSGGWDGSYSLHVEKRDVSPEQYRKELDEWSESK